MEEKAPSFGVLEQPSPLDGEYLRTLHEWGSLPHVVSIPDTARLLAVLCKQNPSAILKVLADAVLDGDLGYWGLSHDGGWVDDMIRVLHPLNEKLRVRQAADGHLSIRAHVAARGKLHIEAMGVHPGDAVRLLQYRGRKVPAELLALLPPQAEPESTTGAKHIPKATLQENEILRLLQDSGFDPLNLPKRKAGAPGAKSAVKAKALKNGAMFTDKSFDKAWERLRKVGQIAGDD